MWLKSTSLAAAIVVILAVIVPSVLAQTNDVMGWQNARWGMSDREIAETFKGRTKKIERVQYQGLHTDRVIEKLELGAYPYTVHFQMDDKTNSLSQVLIFADIVNIIDSAILLQGLLPSLAEKYGPPVSQQRDNAIWAFPTTHILLSSTYSPGIFSRVNIRYYPSASGDSGKL
jgi:hypothetical protein